MIATTDGVVVLPVWFQAGHGSDGIRFAVVAKRCNFAKPGQYGTEVGEVMEMLSNK